MTKGLTNLICFVHQVTKTYAPLIFLLFDHVLSQLAMVDFLINRAARNAFPFRELCRCSHLFWYTN
ncbi:hypothetical protein ABF55_00735 [Enterobacter asburiae]|nr:hypothetical protein YA44_02490 [Enterobacter asburiae]KLP51997.1 hypothetical protein ABF55_00735 [Enterobacter asburiae]